MKKALRTQNPTGFCIEKPLCAQHPAGCRMKNVFSAQHPAGFCMKKVFFAQHPAGFRAKNVLRALFGLWHQIKERFRRRKSQKSVAKSVSGNTSPASK